VLKNLSDLNTVNFYNGQDNREKNTPLVAPARQLNKTRNAHVNRNLLVLSNF